MSRSRSKLQLNRSTILPKLTFALDIGIPRALRCARFLVRMSTPKPPTDMLSQLSNVLPTGTFLVFQILAPLATNNGDCGFVEVVLTSGTLILLCLLCIASSFSDNYKADNGVVYYGFVTPWGLWNPNFKRVVVRAGRPSSYFKGPEEKYVLELDDFVTAAISVVALATISLLTAPVTTCFYPNISDSILKTVPILVGLVVSAVCAFGTTPRNGIGFAAAPHGTATTTPPLAPDSPPGSPVENGGFRGKNPTTEEKFGDFPSSARTFPGSSEIPLQSLGSLKGSVRSVSMNSAV